MRSIEFRNNPMFLRNQFEGTDVFDIPLIRKQNIDLSDVQFIGYDKTSPNDSAHKNRFVHFFLDDYKFEVIWNDPEPRLEKLRQYKGVLSPQYSTYYTMPIALQLYNTFRSRWCGAYLQQCGITVIPTVSWGLPQSYHFCFNGIEEGSIVAVSTIGVRTEKDFFLQGYNELLRRIKPSAVICYGTPFGEMQGKIITVDYAETNNLSPQEKKYRLEDDFSVYKFFCPPAYDPLSCYIITAGMGGGGKQRMGRQYGNAPRNNINQNKQFKTICRKLNLSKEQQNELHHLISHEGLSYQELLEFAKFWFNK